MSSTWVLAVILIFCYLIKLSITSGENSSLQNNVSFHDAKNKIMLFINPDCLCSIATINEFKKIIPHLHNHQQAQVFFEAQDIKRVWSSKAWQMLSDNQTITKIIDKENLWKNKYRVQTSGQVLVFADSGELIFKGGITPERGHEGDNLGRKTIIEWLKNKKLMASQSLVFGCDMEKKL